VHFEQGIPCLLFEEFFTDAASWLGILRQRQEHGSERRFSGAYLYCGRSGQRRHHVHLRSGRHRISNTADGVRRESQYQWISLLLAKQKEKVMGPRESSRLPAAAAGKSKQGAVMARKVSLKRRGASGVDEYIANAQNRCKTN